MRCIGCGGPATTKTRTGHDACAHCYDDGANLSDLLDEVSAFIVRYIAFTSDHQLVAVTLWAAHTYLTHRIRTTPYLHLTSPEPESGKSQLLDVLEQIVSNPWVVVMPSPAVLYRKIDKAQENGGLTLLLDEVDPIFSKRGGDEKAEALRALLNSGYQQGRKVPRCVGPSQKLVDFAVYGPKALAGIGDVPDTISSRCIRIGMKRRKPSEPVEPFFPDEIQAEAENLRSMLSDKVTNLDLGYLRDVRRELLSLGLGDRSADGWSSLMAIADEAGGSWPSWARDAAKDLSRKQTSESDTLGIRLLEDSKSILEGWPEDHVFSSDLRDKLIEVEDAPWADHYGKEISARKIATLLAGYDVRSHTRRIGDMTKKGYAISDLKDAWSRYLPPQSVTSVTSQSGRGETPDLEASQNSDVTDSESVETPMLAGLVTDVTDKSAGKRESDALETPFDIAEDVGVS